MTRSAPSSWVRPAEVAEHVVEAHAAPQHLPGGHRRVEAAGDERDGAALGAEGEAAGAGQRLAEQVRRRRGAPRRGPSPRARRGRRGARRAAAPCRARAPRRARRRRRVSRPPTMRARTAKERPAHLAGEALRAGGDELREICEGHALGQRDRLHAEDPRGELDGARVGGHQVDALVGALHLRAASALGRERRPEVVDELREEAPPRCAGLGRELAREAEDGETSAWGAGSTAAG